MHVRIAFVILILIVIGGCYCAYSEQPEVQEQSYFSSDYFGARKKFLEASRVSGAEVKSFKNPQAGPEGEPLYTDVALLGPKDAKYVLVLESGTHGVEGFAGSAIQIGLLQQGIARTLEPDMGLVMIHAINPFGFAHLRRFNEDNVDLNRNFIDHSKTPPQNEGYGQLADIILPKDLSFLEEVKSRLYLFWHRIKNGQDSLKYAITSGQYTHPQGLFYGGQFETWSHKTLRTIIKHYHANAGHVTFIDIHTGLGTFGKAEVIMNCPKSFPEYKRAVNCWGDLVKTTLADESESSHIKGSVKSAVTKMLPDAVVTAVSLEFGTYSKMEVLWALRAENWLWHRGGDGHAEEKEIKNDLLRAFYPDEESWKQLVWRQGKDVVEQSLRCFPVGEY